MARFEITAPVAGFTGVVAGIAFADGKATVESGQGSKALAYFGRKGYKVVDLEARDAEDANAAAVEPANAVKAPSKSASKADWKAYAVVQGMSEEDAEKATRDQLVEQFADKEGAGQ